MCCAAVTPSRRARQGPHKIAERFCGALGAPTSPLQGEVIRATCDHPTLRGRNKFCFPPGRFPNARARLREWGTIAASILALSLFLANTGMAEAQVLQPYRVVGDAIPDSLTGAPGDPARGKTIVASRQTGLCLLCHPAPLPEEKFQGTIGPDLKGAGSRYTEGQLRLRIVNSSRIDPNTIMPAYYRLEGLDRVAPAFRGKTVLTAEQIEDVVAFLMTLRDDKATR